MDAVRKRSYKCVRFPGSVRRATGSSGNSDASAIPLPKARVRVREARRGRDEPRAARRARRARAARGAPALAPAARLAAGRAGPSELCLQQLPEDRFTVLPLCFEIGRVVSQITSHI